MPNKSYFKRFFICHRSKFPEVTVHFAPLTFGGALIIFSNSLVLQSQKLKGSVQINQKRKFKQKKMLHFTFYVSERTPKLQCIWDNYCELTKYCVNCVYNKKLWIKKFLIMYWIIFFWNYLILVRQRLSFNQKHSFKAFSFIFFTKKMC